MPTYVCTAVSGRLDQQKKQAIVDIVTRVHSEEGGGVPQWLVQVIFNEIPHGHDNPNWFINKRPVPFEQIWIRGDIRPGRSDAQKTAMAERMAAECATASGIEKSYFFVYICDADKTLEFGSVLPQPGQEEAWVAKLPKEVRDRYGLY